jgi:MFS family permease
MFIVVVLGSAISFLIPLYIQIVQGRSSLRTALAIIPYSFSIFAAAILVVRLCDRLSARHIARCAFVVLAGGLMLLAVVIRNEWETFMVILGLIVIGLGQGALATLLFNVLASASPNELAGDVGSLRGVTNHLAGGLGTAIIGALAIGLLSASITRHLLDNPTIPAELKAQVDLDNVTFVSNDRLLGVLQRTTATPDQVVEAVRINTEARLQALKLSFLVLAGLGLLAIFPSGRLPSTSPTNYSGGQPRNMAERARTEPRPQHKRSADDVTHGARVRYGGRKLNWRHEIRRLCFAARWAHRTLMRPECRKQTFVGKA